MATGDAEQGTRPSGEQSPLLGIKTSSGGDLDDGQSKSEGKIITIIWMVIAGIFIVDLILMFTLPAVKDWDPFPNPGKILNSAPVIDGHIGQFIPMFTTPSSWLILRVHNQICLGSFGRAMRTMCLRSVSTRKCQGMLTYRD